LAKAVLLTGKENLGRWPSGLVKAGQAGRGQPKGMRNYTGGELFVPLFKALFTPKRDMPYLGR
jgi:hypothetical protein